MLHDAESDLAQRLEEACAMHDVHDESTGELMRLEETLLEAARAAKQAVSVRRRIRALDGDGTDATATGGQRADDEEPDSVRDFVDESRVEWRVWEVIPGQAQTPARAGHAFGEFQSGWLAFEAVASGMRRRLREYPRDWNRLSNDALEELLQRAEPARTSRRTPGATPRPDTPQS